MKNFSVLSVLALLLCMSFAASAQVRLKDGDLDRLKGVKKINTELTFDGMGVGKFDDEADYVAKKTKEYNEKEAGRGDAWAESWVADREKRFHPQFDELLGKHSEINAGSYPDAELTLVFNTDFTEPGWNVGVMRRPASVSGKAVLVETANRSNVIAEFSVREMPGSDAWGFDFDTGKRLEESYAKTGKEIGQLIKKKLK